MKVFKVWVADDLLVAYFNDNGELVYKSNYEIDRGGGDIDNVLEGLGYEIKSVLPYEEILGNVDEIVNKVIYGGTWDFSLEQYQAIREWIADN